ncbi:MAG: TrmH family RNA methyltransferase [Patescibacteria group bacterium]
MELHFIAHNIRSAENVGALFRTCDSLGITRLWITGYSPTPAHSKVAKTALGAETAVEWEQRIDVTSVVEELRREGTRIVALEIAEGATNLAKYLPHQKTALLLGNEVTGIPPSILALCDDVVAISQRGKKESLNVAVAAGIAGFWMLHHST